jgi:hypothetical protein
MQEKNSEYAELLQRTLEMEKIMHQSLDRISNNSRDLR